MKVRCETFGCTMNRYDSETILGQLKEEGHTVVHGVEEAELIVVNTCGVKGPTQRRVLARLSQLQKNGKKIVVAGCLPLIDLPSIDRLGTFDGMISCRSVNEIGKVLSEISKGKNNVRRLSAEPHNNLHLPKCRSSRVSAIVPISEGCLSACTYCAVRLARGRLRSFSPADILSEIREALRSGYLEILLTAQDTAAYGLDIGTNLAKLLHEINSLEGQFKVRVGMMNPALVKPILPELIDAFEGEHIYKFLHLPVQSGDDEILKAMGRNYCIKDFMSIVDNFRDRFKDLYLATDIIVGFPGEGEEEFLHTCELIERTKPDKVNLTRFSPMPGTAAAGLPQVEGREVKRRSRLLSEKCRNIGFEVNKHFINRTAEALVVEEGKKEGYTGRLPNYKPVIVREGLGEFIKVRITDARPTYLLGEVLEQTS